MALPPVMSSDGVVVSGDKRPLDLMVATPPDAAEPGRGAMACSNVVRSACVHGYCTRGGGCKGRWPTLWENDRAGLCVIGVTMRFSSSAGKTGKDGLRFVARDMDRGGAGLCR